MPSPRVRLICLAALLAVSAAAVHAGTLPAPQATPTLSLSVPGIDTFHPVTTTIACGSNARAEGMAPLRAAGFRSVVSFSEDTEAGYDRPALERAAADAGLTYVSIPLNRDRPDPAAARRFLEVIAAPETAPAYLSCRTGQRAAAMWAIKRAVLDGWPLDRALAEGEALGLQHDGLKQFVRDVAGVR
jgi:uncharacterized protein (TIGR01244 family)